MDLLEPTRQAFALLFSGDRELWGIIWLSLWVSVAALALLAPLCVPLGFVVTRPRPSTTTLSATCPALNGPNTQETVGFAFVTRKSSGLFVLAAALPQAPK